MPAPTPLIFINPQIFLTTGSSEASGGIDLSPYSKSIRITRSFDQHDVTTFGMTDHATALGLGKWQAAITALSEYSSGGLDSIIYPKAGQAQVSWLFVRPNYAARGPSNPEYCGAVRIAEYNPLDGNVGDPLESPITLVGAGSLTRVASCSS